MKLTNLQYVQSILSSLGSDEVNSVSDTAESLQVLEILRTTYFNIISRTNLTVQQQLVQLDSSSDYTIPVLMTVPSGISKLQWLKYYNSNNLPNETNNGYQHDLNLDIPSTGGSIVSPPGYDYVTIVSVRDYLDLTQGFNTDDINVGTFTFTDTLSGFPGTYTFYYKNNKQPQYCTILSNYYVIFDGYDSAVDSTLQTNKTLAYGEVVPHWESTDDFIPPLDEDQVPLLLNEAKGLAYFELKQQVHSKAEQEAKRQWSSVQRNKSIINRPSYFDQLPNFGRAGNYMNVSYFKSRGWDR